jgi:hypothetical protein
MGGIAYTLGLQQPATAASALVAFPGSPRGFTPDFSILPAESTGSYLVRSGEAPLLCLLGDAYRRVVALTRCNASLPTQSWTFEPVALSVEGDQWSM